MRKIQHPDAKQPQVGLAHVLRRSCAGLAQESEKLKFIKMRKQKLECNSTKYQYLSLVSCLLSLISCILSCVSHLLSPVSCLLSLVSYLLSPASYLSSPVSCLLSPVSCLWSLISCLLSLVSRLLSLISCLLSRVSLLSLSSGHICPVSVLRERLARRLA